MLKRPWTEDFLDEVCSFPRATHDDQVIAAAGAFNDLVVTVGEVITVGLNLGGTAMPTLLPNLHPYENPPRVVYNACAGSAVATGPH